MNRNKSITFILASLGIPLISNAQDSAASFYAENQIEIVLSVAALVVVLALLALFTSLYAMKAILFDKKSEEEKAVLAAQPGFWVSLWSKLNNSVPIEEENKVMTSHSYDGIQELDNSLPPWWLYGFYITIIFGVIYLINFHVIGSGDLQNAEYEKDMAAAKIEVETYLASLDNLIDESNVTALDEEVDLIAGQEIFTGKCAACHGQQGEGGVGPNFADKYWIHGGDIASIFKTVKYGVPSKGMIAWQAQLNPKEMQQVSSYIITLEGTNPPNQKEPQGELYERTSDGVESDSVSVEEPAIVEASM
ncbi:MAG: c-type cytochrome [Cyclobacteriaceae bacterium]